MYAQCRVQYIYSYNAQCFFTDIQTTYSPPVSAINYHHHCNNVMFGVLFEKKKNLDVYTFKPKRIKYFFVKKKLHLSLRIEPRLTFRHTYSPNHHSYYNVREYFSRVFQLLVYVFVFQHHWYF